MPNDEYNTYRYDFIDGFERERRVEFLSSTLAEKQDERWIDKDGILSESIEITQMEIANGLTIGDGQSIQINLTFNSNDASGVVNHIDRLTSNEENNGTFDLLFSDYGALNDDRESPYYGCTKAIRVWSGADHWLLPKASAVQYLYLLPSSFANIAANNYTIGANVPKILIYWPDSYGDILEEINSGAIFRRRNAFLYLKHGQIHHS